MFRLARTVEGDRLANERLEGGLVNFFSFVDVDRAACVSVETRVEETGRILQRRSPGEGKLHDILVGFASADDAVVRPNRSAHPLPLLDDVRVCFLDELAHSAESLPAPIPEFGDSFRDELRCRLTLARVRLFHPLILEVGQHLRAGAAARRTCGLREFRISPRSPAPSRRASTAPARDPSSTCRSKADGPRVDGRAVLQGETVRGTPQGAVIFHRLARSDPR